jgi:hypothetical protein
MLERKGSPVCRQEHLYVDGGTVFTSAVPEWKLAASRTQVQLSWAPQVAADSQAPSALVFTRTTMCMVQAEVQGPWRTRIAVYPCGHGLHRKKPGTTVSTAGSSCSSLYLETRQGLMFSLVISLPKSHFNCPKHGLIC